MAEKGQKSETALREEEILKFWKERDIFKKSLEKAAPNGEYVFYDGPPFATGLPHYGHIVASVIKDVVPRYWTMRGFRVPRVWGWDCHGLPIENIVEKELGFKHKKDIKEYGIAKFNERCRERVLTYAHEWEKIIPRIGRWADMEHAYRTMDKPFMESVWWVFKQIYDKGLVYEDYRSMHICPRCETTLSQQEVAEGYDEVKDVAVTIKFKLKDPEKIDLKGDVFLLAWTTTPWTLPGNVALAVRPDLEYVELTHNGPVLSGSRFESGEPVEHVPFMQNGTYILSKDIFWKNMQSNGGLMEVRDFLGSRRTEANEDAGHNMPLPEFLHKYEIKTITGKDLLDLEYEPLFDYYASDEHLKNRENGWKVYGASFVNTEEGTGIVHIAPAFGAEDWELSQKEKLPFVQHVNMDGTFKPETNTFSGKDVSPRAKGRKDEVREIDLEIEKYLNKIGLLFKWNKHQHSYPHCWRCDTPLLNYATNSWFVSVTKIKENLLKNAEAIDWSPAHIKEGRFGTWLEGARDWSISRQRFWASVIPIWVCEACKKQRVFGSVAELEEASGKKIDDLHKHIVDEITVMCECGSTMRRVPDVLDTWFDSGSMPYGEKHYPFEHKEQFEASFPARFIAEGLDQTRAWFYYLHLLAGAIFKKNAFQNVIVNGIVLAEDGKKMSKKLQNYPDPMEVVGKYGADALRLYLLSSPVMQAENLSFSEKGVDDMAKKNTGRLGNVLAFYKLYEDGTVRDWKSENILDRWIVVRLDELILQSTEGYENYRLDEATRPVAKFIDDLSVWYLRRSRERFKEPARPDGSGRSGGDTPDKKVALATLRYVLHRLSLVIAPSMPFFAEHLFQAVREDEDEESVHLATWPDVSVRTGFLERIFGGGNKKRELLKTMQAAREIVSHALETREHAGIKVRQPLQTLEIPVQLSGEFATLIAEEINVKEIKKADHFALDTMITEQLREEGTVREIIRSIQQYRKEQGMKPGEPGTYTISESGNRELVEKYRAQIAKATNMTLVFK